MFAILALLLEIGLLSLINMGQSGGSISNTFATVLILLFSLAFIGYVQSKRKLKLYRSALVFGYLFRVFLLYFDLFGRRIFMLPNSGADSEMFYRSICNCAKGLSYRSGTYVDMMGMVFKLVGTNRLYGQFLNMLFSVVALVFLAYTFNEMNISDVVKHRVYTIVCFLPNYAILSSIFLREAPVNMFITISLFFLVKWYVYKREMYYLLASAFVFPAAALHSGSIAVLAGYIVIRIIYDNEIEKISFKFRNALVSAVIVALAVFVLARTGDRFLGKFSNVETIEDIAKTSTSGGSSYAQYVGDSSSPLSMIVYTIPRVFYFVFSPLPWQWRGLGDIIMFVFSSLFYLHVVLKLMIFLRTKDKHNRSFTILLFLVAIVTVFVFAWGTSNVGTAVRHRDKIITLFSIIWALSINTNIQNIKRE